MMCAHFDECPRANCVGKQCCTNCDDFVTPEQLRVVKSADNAFFRGVMAGIAMTLVVVGVLLAIEKGII